jgi:hypothetical protein
VLPCIPWALELCKLGLRDLKLGFKGIKRCLYFLWRHVDALDLQ